MTSRSPSPARGAPRIVIIGGGFSGAALAWHLHRLQPGGFDITIIEPRPEVGRGLAYGTTEPAHRINVPARRMNISPEFEDHFEQWLVAGGYRERDPASVTGADLYPARAAFGAYMNAQMALLGAAISYRSTTARAVHRDDIGMRVVCDDGGMVEADTVVLAVCHAAPEPPASIASLQHHPRFIANPWAMDALHYIGAEDRVLIVGSGLTMADIVAALDRRQHRGPITVISRRGLLSQSHASQELEPYGDFAEHPETTTLSLLRRVRRLVADASREGISWHPVLDQVRIQGFAVWRALPVQERARLIRHLRPFWDTARFRIAPQVHDVTQRRIADGTLQVRKGSVRAGTASGDELAVDLRARGTQTWEPHTFDAVVLATGPAHRTVFDNNPLLAQMQAAGLARPDPLALGIDVDLQGRVIGRDGQPADALFVASPLARGTFGELMGVPDLARYARDLARIVAATHYKTP